MDSKETKKTIRTFAWASFFNDMGSDMIYPIWPLFVRSFLGANMAVLGFLDGLGDAIVSLSQAGSGYLSDRIRKRKIFIWTGYLFGSLSRLGYALSTHWTQLIPFRVLDRAGKIRGAPRDAIVADISTHENRGRNFGLLRTMDNLGAVCGIVLCMLLVNLIGYRNLFILASIPSAIGAFLIFSFIKEGKPAESKIFKGLSIKDISHDFRLFLFLSSLFALGSFSYSFLLVFAKEFGFNVAFIPALYLIFTVTASLFSLPFGKLSDRIGRKPLLMLAFILWALVCFIFVKFANRWFIIIGFIIYGMHRGALDTVQKTYASELAPLDYRASGLGLFQMVIGLCALPSSLIAGLLWDKMDKFVPFYVSIFLTIASIGLLFFVKEKKI